MPFTAPFRLLKTWDVARITDDSEDYVAAHHCDHALIGQPGYRDVWKIRATSEGVDARPEIDDQIQIDEGLEKTIRRLPNQGITYVVDIADIWVDSDIETRKRGSYRLRPFLRVVELAVKDERPEVVRRLGYYFGKGNLL